MRGLSKIHRCYGHESDSRFVMTEQGMLCYLIEVTLCANCRDVLHSAQGRRGDDSQAEPRLVGPARREGGAR